METQTWGPPSAATASRPSRPNCARARGRLASITMSACRTSSRRIRMPCRLCRSRPTDRFRPLRRSKNRGCRGALRRVVASTRPSPRWRRPGPGGRRTVGPPRGPKVDHDQARHVGSWRRVAESFVEDRGACSRFGRFADDGRPVARAAGPARSGRAGHASVSFAATVDHTAGVDVGTVSSSSQAGTISMSSSRGSDTAMNPSAQRSNRQLPPQLVSPRRHKPIERGPLAQERECVQSRERLGEPIDPFHQALWWSERLVGPTGERHGSAARPALHPGVVHVGRVTSRDPRTSERRSIARRTAQRDPS